MSFSVDQTASVGNSALNNVTCSFSSLPSTTANIVVCLWYASVSTPTVTDSSGNVYTRAVFSNGVNNGNVVSAIYYTNKKLILPGSPPLMITASVPALNFFGMTARSYTNTAQGTFTIDFPARNASGSASTTALSVTSGTPANANSLFVSCLSQDSSGTSEGVSVSGLSSVNVVNNGHTGQCGGMADLIAVDQLTKTAAWTWSAGDSTIASACIIPFFINPQPTDTTTIISQAVTRAAVR